MDPNKALESLLEWAKDREDPVAADAFLALDQWLSRGGFLPDRWKRPVDAKAYNWAKDHEINHQIAEASRAQVRQALTEINQSLTDAEFALADACQLLNLDLPR